MSVAETPAEERVHLETDARSHIARITIDNQARRNTYDPSMRRRFGELLDDVAGNDDIKVLIIRGAGGVFTTGAVEHLGLFTEVCESEAVAERTELWAAKVARMPADGLAIAKTGFNLVEQTQNYIGEHATGFLMHAFATNLRFEDDEFNFVKARAKH